MSTKTETFYVICKKGDRTKIMSDHTENEVEYVGDVADAYISRRADHLFFMLEEYSKRFKGEWEVVKITETKTVEYVASDATEELESFRNSR